MEFSEKRGDSHRKIEIKTSNGKARNISNSTNSRFKGMVICQTLNQRNNSGSAYCAGQQSNKTPIKPN